MLPPVTLHHRDGVSAGTPQGTVAALYWDESSTVVDLREFRWAGAIHAHAMRKSRIRAGNLNHCCINPTGAPVARAPAKHNDSRLRQSCQTHSHRHILTGHSQAQAHCDLRGVSVLTG
jgi:hypothetical protein